MAPAVTSLAIRSVHSPDVEEVWAARPLVEVADPFLVELEIGPADGVGRDLFSVVVGTQVALRALPAGRHLAIEDLPSIEDTAGVVDHLRQRVAGCEAEDWPTALARLRSFLDWEYDGYRPDL
jgi:hypothetical protein